MSDSDFGRELSVRGRADARGRLTPARLRLLRLRRIIRLRRKLRRARQAPPRACDASRASRVSLPGLVALFALGAAAAVGCGWAGTEHSVRFNYWHGERQFSRLPPLPFDARARTKPDYRDEAEGEEGVTPDDADAKATGLWARATEAELRGDYAQLRKHLGAFLEVAGAGECGSFADASVNCRQRLNSARDRLDALASLERGASAQAVGAYLAARRAYDRWLPTTDGETAEEAKHKMTPEEAADPFAPVKAALDAVPRDASVEDNVAYLRAALFSESGERARGADAFERLAARYPRSEKREAALLSAGLSWMKASNVGPGTVEHAASEDACPDCKGEPWRKAVAAFERLLRDYPEGRYAGDARGWLAFLRVRVGERAEGLAEYYRMLADERDAAASEEALRSIRLVRGGATEEEMSRVEALLEGEPRAALAYAYHEIYNAALGFGLNVEASDEENPYRYCMEREGGEKCYEDFYKWAEKARQKYRRDAEEKSLARVAAFATRVLRSRPGGAVGGAFTLRVAQADLELGEDAAARELAARALSAGLAGNERASALWVKGAAEYRLKDFDATRRTFASLLSEFPDGDLTEGARRYVALAAEEQGDLGAALEQYLALDYRADAAYFMDVLMTTEQLASFAERRADSPERDVLFYSLGVRLMRAHRFAEARAAYARARTAPEPSGAAYVYDNECERSYPPPHCTDSKNARWQEWEGVRAEWVLRDLRTMEEMERLEERVGCAAGEEALAEALYQLASYLYESSELVFYNPAAWRGERFYAFYYDQRFRAPGEAALMRRHMEEHEPVVRALDIYLRVAEQYPRTRAARDSLYTTAVIHERLAGFELYWPGQYREGLHPGARFVTYEDVRRTYPGYSMPAGTYGWEPSTRTVNGREAWPAPPRPPRLTGEERARLQIKRAERRVALLWDLFGEVYGGRVRAWTVAAARWAAVALAGGFVLLVFRRTRRARRFLYRQLRRGRRPARARETYAPPFSYAAPGVTGAGLRDAAGQTARNLLRLALHERGRAALALNLFTHGLLTLLLWAIFWASR